MSNMSDMAVNTGMTVYGLNKQYAEQKVALTKEEKENAAKALNGWVNNETMKNTNFIFAFCPEDRYITVFHRIPKNPKRVAAEERFGEQVIECLEAYGTIKSIDTLGTDTAEAWVEARDEMHYVLFFDGERGVVNFAG